MTEAQFFRRAAVVATGLTLVAFAWDRVSATEAAYVMPGEPWRTVVGGAGVWLGSFSVCHVGRWIYLVIRGRELKP